MSVAARASLHPSLASAAPRGRQEGASRARASPGKTLLLARLARPHSQRAHRLMAARTRRGSLARPPLRPAGLAKALLRRGVSARDLAARGPRKGDPAEEGVPPSSRKDQPKGASAAIGTVSLDLRVGKLRPERDGDCPRSAADARSGTVVFRSYSLSARTGGDHPPLVTSSSWPLGAGVVGAALRPKCPGARAPAGWV